MIAADDAGRTDPAQHRRRVAQRRGAQAAQRPPEEFRIATLTMPGLAGTIQFRGLTMKLLLLAAILAAGTVDAQTRTGSGPQAGAQGASADATLFAASWCAYCRQARAHLARARIRYTDVDIDSPAGKAAYEAAGGGGVPLLVFKGEQLRGYSELAYDYFLARHE